MNQLPSVVSSLPVLASGHEIDILGFRSGEWVDGETMGRKMGSDQPRKYINKLFNRYKKHFKEGESIVVNLTTIKRDPRGGKPFTFERKMRLFSVPNGTLRLCMLSNTPNRHQVQDEILELFQTISFAAVLKTAPTNEEIPLTEWLTREIERRLGPKKGKQIIKDMLTANYDHATYIMPMIELAKHADGAVAGTAVAEEAKRRGCCANTVYRDIKKTREAFGIPRQPTKRTGKPRRPRFDTGTHKNQAEYEQAIEYKRVRPEAGAATIKAALGLEAHKDTIKKWIRGI
jgi:hypothetical protein